MNILCQPMKERVGIQAVILIGQATNSMTALT